MSNKNVPQVFNQSMECLCYLDKATGIGYTQVYNDLWRARFTLPADDPKNIHCKPFNYVEIYDDKRRIELFRILPSTLSRAANGYITYECEHVIATLIDNVLFKYHQIGNVGVYTPEVISYVLSKQTTKNWKLGQCDFRHQFLYKWENENLCSALFSIPKPFIEEYHFTYDTLNYPWTLNLVRAETSVGCEIRYRKNMQAITKDADPTNLVTRLYALGYGEGDNQLTIESVNGGLPYIEADTMNTYRMKEAIWVDRRFEDAESLKATAQSMLNELKIPYMSYTVSSLDLFKKTKQDFDEYREGKVVRVIDKEDGINFDAKIVEIDKADVARADISIIVANKNKDVAGSIADMQERARINETYAQGSASLMTIPYIDNADTNFPAIFDFFIPSSMVRVNNAKLRIQLLPFRGYSKAIKGGGSIVTSTASGGGSTQTSTDGGGTTTSTSSGGNSTQTSTSGGGTTATSSSGGGETATSTSGGGSTATSSSGGATTSGASSARSTTVWDGLGTVWFEGITTDYHVVQAIPDSHNHVVNKFGLSNLSHSHGMEHDHSIAAHTHSVTIQDHSHSVTTHAHTHSITIQDHSHSISIPAHTHGITIADHSHSITIPSHTHSITLPEHTHEIEFGIYLGTTANSITIKVDGNAMPAITNYNEINIIKYMAADNSGRITRDTWHRLEIIPDRLTRISACLFLDIFTNSRGGGDY